jgi:putative aldouronate transport system substrate-binding protein
MKRIKMAVLVIIAAMAITQYAWSGGVDEGRSPGTENTQKKANAGASGAKTDYSFFAFNWNMYAGAENDAIFSFLEKKFNVIIRLSGAPEDSWMTKINLLVNSGETPDLFFYTPGNSQYKQWVTDGMLLPLEPFIEQGSLQNLKALLGSNQLKYSTFNGEHYFVPNIYGEINHALFVRKDWMDKWIAARKLSVKRPETLAQFEDMLKFFTEEDPDGNGKNDTIGMAASSETAWFNNFLAAFNVTPAWTKEANGEYGLTALTDGYRKMLNYLAGLYSKRYIYGDFYSINDAQKVNLFTSGKCGAVLTNNGAMVDHIANQLTQGILSNQIKTVNDFYKYVDILPMPNGEYPGAYQGANRYFGGWSVSSDAKDPLTLASILDYLVSPEGQMLRLFGIEGKHYTKGSDGSIVPNVAERAKEPNRWQITDLTRGYLGGKNMLGVYFSENRFAVDSNNNLAVTYDWPIFKHKELVKKSYDMITGSKLNYDDGVYIIDFSSEFYDKMKTINDEIKSSFILIVTGQKKPDDQIEAMKKRLDALGYANVKTEYNRRIKGQY